MMKRRIFLLFLVCILLLSCGCAAGPARKEAKITIKSTVFRDEKYDSATIAMSQAEFEEAGFRLGDSCDIEFENGYKATDFPYYNGYYVKTGAPVLVAYPGNANVLFTLNNMGIWTSAGLQENMTVTITRNVSGKYSAVQESLGQMYSFDRNDYESDEQFSNFRALSGGNLKQDYLYRGASPADNSRGRAPYTDALLKARGVGFILDLADSEENISGYMSKDDFTSDYFKSLYEDGHVALLSMSSSYQSEEYRQKLVSGLKQMLADGESPIYIHCMEGKDRTGFVCLLLEALAGADYEEMLSDYMFTYRNYYSVSKEGTPEKYDAIADLYFNAFMEYLHGTDDIQELKNADYSGDAADYLREGGMSDAEIGSLTAWITK